MRRYNRKQKFWKAGSLRKNKAGGLGLVPMIMAVVIAFVLIYVGLYITGTIHDEAIADFGVPLTRSTGANRSLTAMNNTSDNFVSGLNIINIAIIITIFASIIGAIMLFVKYK